MVCEYKIVKDKALESSLGERISGDADASRIAHSLYEQYYPREQEVLSILFLNTKNRVIGTYCVGIGTLASCTVHPRDIFKPLILSSAASFILVHNHPSRDVTPSEDDSKLTKRIKSLGNILGTPLLDHLILSEDGDYYSFAAHGAL